MKFISICLLAILLITQAEVRAQINQLEKAKTYLDSKNEVYFKFQIADKNLLSKLTKYISIDNFQYPWVYAYANEKEFNQFLTFNIAFETLKHPGDLDFVPKMFSEFNKNTMAWDAYPTYDAYVNMMYQYATDYPELCRIVEVGKTVMGRKILFAVISNNVNTTEAEPRFMYTSSMHGDETTGYMMMLRLIDYLLSNYGSSSRIQNMINNTEIWINPLENPDGTYQNDNSTISGCQRYNANAVDLNRNYKNPGLGDHPDGESWQPETIAMMNLLDSINFVMSANNHGGIELVNYPWDTWRTYPDAQNPDGYYTTHADQDWFIDISSEFRDLAQANSPVGYFDDEDNGITHGADWYFAWGSRQDYATYYARCREVTFEISNTKTISGSQLPNYWNYLYEAYLTYLERVQYGFRGIVVDSLTLEPIRAHIFINNHDRDNSDIYTELPLEITTGR
jgi:hypothetical protein